MRDMRASGPLEEVDVGTPVTAVAVREPALAGREDRVVAVGWKVDRERFWLDPDVTVYTLYRDPQRRREAIVSFIPIAGY